MKKSLIVLALFLVFGCNDDELAGGPCEYSEIPGVVVITSIEPARPNLNNCRNAVEVLFDFTPDDSTASKRYLHPSWPDTDQRIIVGDGKNPAAEWVSAQEIAVGKEYRCLRTEITTGTCVPVIFEIVEIDFSNWADYCF